MKRIAVFFLSIAICCSLCACGGKKVALPTKPTEISKPSTSVQEPPGNNDATAERPEVTESKEEAYPWEVEFREDDYIVFTHTEPKIGKFTSYFDPKALGTCVRTISEYADGEINDTYFYPNGVDSHSYRWYADGSYAEYHHLNDGRVDLTEKKTYLGTVIYQKNIAADGSWSEFHTDENGVPTFSATMATDGSYWEASYYADGISHIEVTNNPSTGESGETVYYESGNTKYSKYESPECVTEEAYDEDGFHTYYYYKDTGYEIELTSDDVGKLVKAVENGTIIENTTAITQFVQTYNFRQ